MIPGSAIPLLLATAGPTFNPRPYFDVKLYTGNGSTQTISGLNFSPDLVWIKNRGGANNHAIYDVQRGAYVQMQTNLAYEDQNFNPYGVTAFNSDGFGLNDLSNGGYNVNGSSMSYVAWTWDAGSSTVTNTQGSITSQVRANASAGFSVVTYSATGSGGATIGHGLNIAPSFIISKQRIFVAGGTNWQCYHASIGNTSSINLNTTGTPNSDIGWWNNTSPTSTVYSVGTYNRNGGDYVAYCFAPVAGYSSFGSYTGNGSATGPVISGLGFQPYFVMIKASSTTGDWWMYDGARSPSNPRINKLKANTSGAEDTAGEDVDFQLDGFQIKTSDSGLNQNAATYIYAAFA